MTRQLEHDVSPARRLALPILERHDAGADYVRLVLGGPADWVSLPGQFLNVRCGPEPQAATVTERREVPYIEDGPWPQTTGPELARRHAPLVRRPLSISRIGSMPDGVRIEVLVHTIGTGTRWLAEQPAGTVLDVVGPLGNGFTLPLDGRVAVLVGGGCGMAPLFGLADVLADLGRDAVLIIGAPGVARAPLEFETPPPSANRAEPCTLAGAVRSPFETVFATDDGSAGFRGTAVAAAEAWLADRPGNARAAFYGCGPEPMLRALADLARRIDAPCQVSLEEFMGCGIGVCLSCARKMHDPANPAGWTYRLTCREGPVVEASDIVWEK